MTSSVTLDYCNYFIKHLVATALFWTLETGRPFGSFRRLNYFLHHELPIHRIISRFISETHRSFLSIYWFLSVNFSAPADMHLYHMPFVRAAPSGSVNEYMYTSEIWGVNGHIPSDVLAPYP